MPFHTVVCDSCGENNIDVLVVDGICFACLVKRAEEMKKESPKPKEKPKADKELEDLLL